jgi:hypothetical protein
MSLGRGDSRRAALCLCRAPLCVLATRVPLRTRTSSPTSTHALTAPSEHAKSACPCVRPCCRAPERLHLTAAGGEGVHDAGPSAASLPLPLLRRRQPSQLRHRQRPTARPPRSTQRRRRVLRLRGGRSQGVRLRSCAGTRIRCQAQLPERGHQRAACVTGRREEVFTRHRGVRSATSTRVIPTREAPPLSTQMSSRLRSCRAAASLWAVSAAGVIRTEDGTARYKRRLTFTMQGIVYSLSLSLPLSPHQTERFEWI